MTMTLADAPVDDGVVSPRAERPKRRTFTAEYKLGIVAEYDAAEPGEKGALAAPGGAVLLALVEWRRARDAGALAGLAAKPRGPAAQPGAGRDRPAARDERAAAGRSWPGPRPRWTSWEKHTRSWRLLSESADTEKRSKR